MICMLWILQLKGLCTQVPISIQVIQDQLETLEEVALETHPIGRDSEVTVAEEDHILQVEGSLVMEALTDQFIDHFTQ